MVIVSPRCFFFYSDSCGYTSSSESEVGDHGEGESGSNRRMRTKFTSDQIFRLEKTFNKHKYLGATQRRKIAEKLQLSETQVSKSLINKIVVMMCMVGLGIASIIGLFNAL